VLGHDRYIAQGGDWGSSVAAWMAHDYPEACAGLHLNMAIMGHAGAKFETDEERAYRNAQIQYREFDGGYAHIQRTRPQSLGFALQDSPVGTAAWILEKFAAWSDVPRPDGQPQLEAAYSIDHLLTNVMLYVATGAITTSTWIYLGNTLDKAFPLEHPVTVPTAVAAFPDPIFSPPPRSLAEKSYRIVRWTDMPRGGHFAAMEQPELFSEDLRAFARDVCQGNVPLG
jgi:pimeloyl-ACP methyl ester carboxylesterase